MQKTTKRILAKDNMAIAEAPRVLALFNCEVVEQPEKSVWRMPVVVEGYAQGLLAVEEVPR